MRKYATEAHFSKHLCEYLRSRGYFVQRIETRETGRGVPDLYVGAPGNQYWIELKRVHTRMPGILTVPWRPGQQAWMYQHYRTTGVPCFTFVAYDDCIAAILHDRMYRGDSVNRNDLLRIWGRTENVQL